MMACGDKPEPVVTPPDDNDDEEQEVFLTNRQGLELSTGESVYFEDYYDNGTGRFILGLFSEDYATSGNVVTKGTAVRIELLSELAADAKFPSLAAGTYTVGELQEAYTGLCGASSFVISKDAAVLGDIESGTVKVFREEKRYGF
jgi:hypothetical protein